MHDVRAPALLMISSEGQQWGARIGGGVCTTAPPQRQLSYVFVANLKFRLVLHGFAAGFVEFVFACRQEVYHTKGLLKILPSEELSTRVRRGGPCQGACGMPTLDCSARYVSRNPIFT